LTGSVDWYGGQVSPDAKIVCTGKFRKFFGSISELPPNISCAGGLSVERGHGN
jgi:hypothetical protein